MEKREQHKKSSVVGALRYLVGLISFGVLLFTVGCCPRPDGWSGGDGQ